MDLSDWNSFFYPKSVAVVGASRSAFKFGNRFLQALLDFQYSGKIYPVNPRGEKILGLDSWMLEDIPEPVDLIYITVPAPQVPAEIQKCVGITKSVIILTAGFKETGEKGREVEEECAKIARTNGIRIIGPNCFGIYHPKGGITLLPGGAFPKESGNIAMLSQSGGHSVNFVMLGQSAGLKFSNVISYGNALDLDLPDFLEYFNQDPDTELAAAYTEGVRNIQKLRQVLLDFKKPLVLWKSGLTEDGARAAASHTGFLSGQAEVWNGFFIQFRNKIIRAHNFEELIDTTKAMAYLPNLDYEVDYINRVGVIGGGGGIGIEISDSANKYGLKVPKLTEETKENLKKLLPLEGTSINNPLDIGNPLYMGEQKDVLKTFLGDPSISVLVYDFIVDFVFDLRMMVRIIRELKKQRDIPVVVVLRELLNTAENISLEKTFRKFRDKFHEIRVPVYPSFYRAIRALSNYLYYYKNYNKGV